MWEVTKWLNTHLMYTHNECAAICTLQQESMTKMNTKFDLGVTESISLTVVTSLH